MRRSKSLVDRHLFDEAVRLKRQGNFKDALSVLRKLHRSAPNDASTCALIGEINWSQGKLGIAIRWLSKATREAPRSELASLGLFHVLWEANKEGLALAEMNRFLAISDSKEYRSILKGLPSKAATA